MTEVTEAKVLLAAQKEQVGRVQDAILKKKGEITGQEADVERLNLKVADLVARRDRMQDQLDVSRESLGILKGVLASEREAAKALEKLISDERHATLDTHVEGKMAFGGEKPEHL